MAKRTPPQFTTRQYKEGALHYLSQPYEIIDKPMWWHEKGLSETASGYGRKLTSSKCVKFPDGRLYRIYITCFSNSGTTWIQSMGRHLIVD